MRALCRVLRPLHTKSGSAGKVHHFCAELSLAVMSKSVLLNFKRLGYNSRRTRKP